MNLPPVVRQYALTYLLPGTLTQHQVDEIKVKVASLLKKHEAKITKEEDWGKKTLAYQIKSEGKTYHEAYYTHQVFSLASAHAQALERDIYLNGNIIRHLMVVDEPGSSTAVQAEVTAKAEEVDKAPVATKSKKRATK